MTKKTFKANKAVNLKNFITKLYLKINKKQNDRKCTRQYKKTIFNSDDLFILINQRIRINRTAWQIHAVMQMGGSGFGVAGFADIADDLSFFHTFIQADAGKFVEVGIVVPCARLLAALLAGNIRHPLLIIMLCHIAAFIATINTHLFSS